MLDFDMLRQTLYGQAIQAVVQNGNFKCRIGDEPFVAPTDGSIYGEFWFKAGTTKQMELGPRTGFECTPGVLQFTLYAPEKTGEGPVLRLADALKKAFNRKQWVVPPDGYVTIDPMSVQPLPNIKQGHKVVIIDASFDFYHRDPAATP
jgi:hypothetical protein